ncbi:MAG: OmpP1/FadL family transporter [Phyllobacterium sp.]|uniref:OmpP1/FadL family transporter n=1 Tax=Phyllobacterium sp. TaxID=1871046 RepID=UPI0030F35143
MSGAISKILGGALLLTSVASAAQAGGLERGGYNWELLFEPGRFASEAGAVYVMPDRKIENAHDTNPRDGSGGPKTSVDETPDYTVPRFGAKVGLTDDADCLASYSEPWGVHTEPGFDWQGNNQNIETKIRSHNYGLTCSYRFDVGKGQLRAIGGVSYQEVSGFKRRMVLDPTIINGALSRPGRPFNATALGFDGSGLLDLEADGVGWRIGAAYEIPEYAFRVSLIYNAEVDLGQINGTVDLTEIPGVLSAVNPFFGKITDVYGTATMPQSVDFRWQTGIAPDWLAFGNVKWVDWSVLEVIAFCPTSTKSLGSCGPSSPFRLTSLDLMFQDGWTVAAGLGHKFNDQWSASAQLSWDRGTSTGLTTQTDTYLLSSGVAYAPNKNVELRVGGAIGMLTSGSYGPTPCPGTQTCGTDVTYDFGDDLVTALSISGKVKF